MNFFGEHKLNFPLNTKNLQHLMMFSLKKIKLKLDKKRETLWGQLRELLVSYSTQNSMHTQNLFNKCVGESV